MRHRAFTLVELLVVIAIIGILLGLLLPAVQAAREAARIAQCQNNFKQLGLALHAYHTTFQRFPAGYVSRAAAENGEDLGPGWGWAVQILPYLEQANLQRQIDFGKEIAHAQHARVCATSLPVLLCPSDGPAGPTFQAVDGNGTPLATVPFANYVAMAGTHEVSGFPDTNNGVFYRNSRTRIEDIRDGTSHTLFLTERGSHKSPMTTWIGALPKSVNPPRNPEFEEEGPATLVLTNTGEAAEGRVPNNAFDHVEDASSRHPAGVVCLLGDGSVRVIQNTVRGEIWESLGTRAGKEVLGGF